ncbi:unnamed protein product [Sordaria macrospora k-hell]|uniref:WGS project CABT00000000 data, contig 2.5 n=1 Tax=Sordaria macrospora (strain ATCC MYA-333 / DSM 997 / K(L3346) / K-hell) TaxID=771870 RepID=F7VS27_SORMK|nr:uncharacterized protein SMAC_01861 [Sordaria macrospora k-hell]CCC08313.1 unnamed protein product [Sordaria macrospora k-hell]
MVSPSTRSTRSRYSSPRQIPSGSVDPIRGQRSASASGSGSGGSGGSANASSSGSGSGGKSKGNGGGSGNSKSSGTEGQKTFMDRWLEPPVQNKPSFADAGLVRHGVVEGMAPLGTMPKAGFFKKATPAPPPPEPKPFKTTRIVIKRPLAPPAPAPVPAATTPAPEEDETEDEEESGNGSIMTGADETGSESMTPGPIFSASTRRPLPISQTLAISHGLIVDPRTQMLDTVIERAVEEAVAHHRYPTAYALKTLYDDPRFRVVAEKVFTQTADAGILKEFAEMLHQKKKEAKRKNMGLNYFENMTAMGQTPPQPQRASYGHLVKFDISAVRRYRDAVEQQRAGSGDVKQEEEASHEGAPERVRELQQQSSVVQQQSLHQHNQQDLQYRQRLQLQQEQRQPQHYQPTYPEPGPHPKPNPEQGPQPEQPVTRPEPELAPTSEPALEQLPLDPQLLNPPHQQSPLSPQPPSPPQHKQKQQAPQPELVSNPVPRISFRGGKLDKEEQEYEDQQSHSDPPLDLSSSHLEQDPEEEGEKEQELLLDSKTSATKPALALATVLAPASPEPEQEQRPPDHEQEAEGGIREVHVRKKHKSPKKPESAKAKMVVNGVNGTANSISSSSSLSSARSLSPPADEYDGDGLGTSFAISATSSRASPAPIVSPPAAAVDYAASGADNGVKGGNHDAAAPRPITVRRRINVRRKGNVSPALPSPASPTGRQSDSLDPAIGRPYEMPAVVDAPLFPNLNSKKGSKSGVQGVVFPSKVGRIDENDPKYRLRQSAKKITANYNKPFPESFTRESYPSEEPSVEVEEMLQSSPTAAAFPASDVASTAANSRAGTPVLRPAKKPRTGLRVKNSLSSLTAYHEVLQDDNDDYCSSCGGNGQLICCDGCTRSFHFSCVDPPLMQGAMPDEWFCNVCRTAHKPPVFPVYSGPFASLMEKLDAKNSSAFALPLDVREYFEAVRTGQDGEYEEIVPLVKPPAKKKNDEESGPDFFRLRDDKGDPAVCHLCQGGASARTRAIIPCSLCGLFWHLDCLDPPLANPPVLRTWKCPCHVDDLLAKVPGQLAPAHKFRKIKGASVIRPAYSRAYINNGYIEVEPEDSDDESGWKNVETYGKVVRLPAKGIKLDFLSRVRENRKGKPIPPLNIPQATGTGASVGSSLLNKRSLEEQQAVYNLAALSGQGTSGVNILVDALLAQADPSVISLMASGNSDHLAAGKLNHMDQQSLRAMLAQMEKMTNQIKSMLEPVTPVAASQDQLVSSKVPSLTNSSQSITDGESEKTVRDLMTTPTVKKELPPSPAATDDVATAKHTKEPGPPRRKKRNSNGRKSADSDTAVLQNGDMDVDA